MKRTCPESRTAAVAIWLLHGRRDPVLTCRYGGAELVRLLGLLHRGNGARECAALYADRPRHRGRQRAPGTGGAREDRAAAGQHSAGFRALSSAPRCAASAATL